MAQLQRRVTALEGRQPQAVPPVVRFVIHDGEPLPVVPEGARAIVRSIITPKGLAA